MRLEVGGWRLEVGGGSENCVSRATSDLQLPTSNFQLRKSAITATIITLALLLPEVASACAVCYGNPQSPLTKAADNATIFLLVIVGFVQLGFIALFWTLWRRAKANQRHREQFHVIHGGVR